MKFFNKQKSTTDPSINPIDSTLLEIQDADTLLSPLKSELEALKEHVGVGETMWSQYYEALVKNYAEFVQNLPASASHHHRGAGGLLHHSIEVAIRALKICDSQQIQPTSGSGYHDTSKDLLLYATFSAALLHDLGKVLTDQQIILFDQRGQTLGGWLPLAGTMRQIPKAHYYRVSYLEQRVYRIHQMASLTLMPQIIPVEGLSWLSNKKSLSLFYCWLYAVGGELSNAEGLGKAIQAADSQSVAASLGGSEESVSESAGLPLHDKLLSSLQAALESGDIKINQPGATCFIYEGRAYFVVKTLLDYLRKYLATHGVSSVPTDNNRLMDVLLEQHILIPNPTNNKAIWKIEVILEQDPPWRQSFTTIVIDEQRAFKGTYSGRALQGRIAIETSETGAETATTPDNSATAAVIPPAALEEVDHSDFSEPEKEEENFLDWLTNGLNEGLLIPNGRGSKVHMLDDNKMFIVSPAIFKAFDTSNWSVVQKFFEKIGIIDLPEGEGTSFFKAILRPAGHILTGYIISNPEIKLKGLKASLPEANPNLSLFEGEGKSEGDAEIPVSEAVNA